MIAFIPALFVAGIAAHAGSVRATPLPDSIARRIDSIFAPYDHSDVPGCAVGVYQNGAIAFEKGYGSANLEYAIPISPTTPFIMGSVSKQFTAAAIALLADEGRLSLDDDVRKYVPELPDYGQRITIDELVHHTSGLRDFWALVEAAGMRLDDTYAVPDVLALAARQKHLEFTPGTEYDYSNTGYVVLGEIVRRVSGKSLARFAADEIFAPLGMTHTHFQDDHTVLVPGRAYAYMPHDGGWRIDVWNNDIVGQGGLMTTVEDLQKWDENFYTGRVGGPRLLARQLSQGRLANGTVLSYAFGLEVGTYRGLRLVEHTGSTGGYRTIISRFPTVHTSVVALCNASNVNTTTLSHRVADAVLSGSFTESVPAQRVAADPPRVRQASAPGSASGAEDVAAFAGRYHSDELDATFAVRDSSGILVLQRPRRPAEVLSAVGAQAFRAGNFILTFTPAGFTLDVGRARGIEFTKVR